MTDGPLKRAFDLLDSDGVLSRTLITYRKKKGMLVKETVTRDYFDNDYTDCTSTKPIIKIEGE